MRNIIHYPDPLLLQPTRHVDDPSNCVEIIRNMTRVLHTNNALGLAANQVGEDISIIVIDGRVSRKTRPLVLINPQYTWKSDEMKLGREGCLSMVDTVDVSRHMFVTVEAFDQHGRKRTVDGTKNELLSRVLQHEIDHLLGITMLERAEHA